MILFMTLQSDQEKLREAENAVASLEKAIATGTDDEVRNSHRAAWAVLRTASDACLDVDALTERTGELFEKRFKKH